MYQKSRVYLPYAKVKRSARLTPTQTSWFVYALYTCRLVKHVEGKRPNVRTRRSRCLNAIMKLQGEPHICRSSIVLFFSTSVSFRCVRMTLTDRETILWSFGQLCSSLSINKCKKLQFIHTVNGDGSKTAKIIKRQC